MADVFGSWQLSRLIRGARSPVSYGGDSRPTGA